jgi:diguanylate cyclase (GGDEF)-like protein/PAS domain S-box-containing protein
VKTRYLSLISDPPAGFVAGPVGKRELLSGVVVLLAPDCPSAYALLPDFQTRVEGLVLTFGDPLIERVGPLLWHRRLPRAALAGGRELLDLALEVVAVASAERNAALVAGRAQERLRSDHATHIRDYLSVTASLRDQVELIAASENKLSTILDSVDAYIYLKDRQGAYLFANRPLRDLWRVDMKDVVGASDERFYDAATAALIRIDERRVLDAGETVRTEENHRDPAGGRMLTLLSTKLPLRREDGGIYALCGISTDITSRKNAEDEIRQLAFFDPLTHLPNRRLLIDRMEQALAASVRHQHYGALLYIDLDHFKNLNDTLGHDTGDVLLQQVAGRLVACVREEDTVARLGGDEFVVMLSALSRNEADAAKVAESVGEKVLASFGHPFDLAGHEHRCTASIGVALFVDRQATIEDLLKRADLSMYQAKGGGRNALRFFNPQMQIAVTQRVALENELSEAVAKNQLELYYQAQIGAGNHLSGAEVLLRWNHPQRGLVLPGEFIALAEETGLIQTLGRWVLQTTCAQLARWARRPETARLTIAVNVSARQFHQDDFVDQLLAIVDASGANPQRLKLELTESLLVTNVEDVIAKMTALKARGVGFSLDDFGTGYSSLSYLKRLPLDQLKIDQSFVRDILVDANDAAIAKMIVALADTLGLVVVAEGVETVAQQAFLARLGCHCYQGYLFSRPAPLEAFEQFAGLRVLPPP